MANSPGQTDVATYQPVEIRAIIRNEADWLVPVTLAATNAEIPAGTVLGMITASKLYIPYAKASADGSQVAKLILAETVPASTDLQNAGAYATGIFYKDKLNGLDADAITAWGAREPVPNLLIV